MKKTLTSFMFLNSLLLLSILLVYSCSSSRSGELKGTNNYPNFPIDELKVDTNVHLYDPFDSIVFDSVVCYNFDVDSITGITSDRVSRPIQNSKVIDSLVCSPRTLNKVHIDSLRQVLINPDYHTHRHMGCFIPHLVFVFFDNGKVSETLYVCFMCADLGSSFHIPARQYYGKGALNMEGYRKMHDICKSLNMLYLD
jgi:hypothetical protein